MKHSKVVLPSDSSTPSQESLPDRSNLSKLYPQVKSDRVDAPENKATDTAPPAITVQRVRLSTLNQNIVSFFLTVPLVAIYLAMAYVYLVPTPAPLKPIIGIFISFILLSSFYITFRVLRTQFYKYPMSSMDAFMAIYLFYLLPILKITYFLFPVSLIGILLTIFLWLIANRLIILYMVWAINRSAPSNLDRHTVILLPVVVLIILAILS